MGTVIVCCVLHVHNGTASADRGYDLDVPTAQESDSDSPFVQKQVQIKQTVKVSAYHVV